eukprot:scaffold67260_cov28-Prasinocladus_malaysianus.AAC.2
MATRYVATLIHDKYLSLASAIQTAGKWRGAIEIHPILVSRTGSIFSGAGRRTGARPPNESPVKRVARQSNRPPKRIARATMHVHAIQWFE